MLKPSIWVGMVWMLALCSVSAAEKAPPPDSAWTVQVHPSAENKLKQTTKEYVDEFTLKGGVFTTKVTKGYGYPDGKCEGKLDGAKLAVTATVTDEKHGTNNYEFSIVDGKLTGTLKWSKTGEDGKPKTAEYTLTGTQKK